MLKHLHAEGAVRSTEVSAHLHRRGRGVFPAGITRSTVECDPYPLYLAAGEGAYVTDVDGNRYLDLNNNFTTLVHGHGYAPVAEAVAGLLRTGTCFSNPTRHEIALAELLISRIPAIEQVRFVNTGTEAVMFAIKAARAFTGKPAIARFAGAYHGAYDWAEIGQSAVFQEDQTHAMPGIAYEGAPRSTSTDVVLLDFNDADGLEQQLLPHVDRLAAILIDPVPSRAGLLAPDPQFIERLTAFARANAILIIADEVLNLRQSFKGASARYGLVPDLITAGKIIGGGFPIGAIGGRVDVMSVFGGGDSAPLVPQGGTFSANPVAMVAGLVAMQAMTKAEFDRLERLGDDLRGRLTAIADKHSAAFSINGAASLFRIHPKPRSPATYREALMTADQVVLMKGLGRFFQAQGVMLPFGAAACLSTPMTQADTDLIAAVFEHFITTELHRYEATKS
ncbi:aspartate aminotransferase family protein [Rhizobium sp. RU36D]|uniref:aspartate aminotransferase family protein n=1 Tax=Rhizobium sp. RU36D TaxID=1907415 RepID=UPI0009D83962|nr:aspartate aminotransferase family protein [Rhizobium sp. RU36D]SMD20142.1 glutamate-1-semialdehyde 2,1-aminomutase [Rhizobium sp. RU36D]